MVLGGPVRRRIRGRFGRRGVVGGGVGQACGKQERVIWGVTRWWGCQSWARACAPWMPPDDRKHGEERLFPHQKFWQSIRGGGGTFCWQLPLNANQRSCVNNQKTTIFFGGVVGGNGMSSCLNQMTMSNFQGSLHIGLLLLLITIVALGRADLSQFYDQVEVLHFSKEAK